MNYNSKVPRKLSNRQPEEDNHFFRNQMNEETGPFRFSDDSGPLSPASELKSETKY